MRIAIFLTPILLCGVAASAATWSIKTAQLETIDGEITAISDSGVALGENRTLSWDEFLQADRASVGKPAPASYAVVLTNGDRLCGEPAGVSGEKLKWHSGMIGEMPIPLMRIVAITKANQPAPQRDEKRTEDSVSLTNGDTVRGIISDVTDSAVIVQASGQAISVPLKSLVTAQFASAGEKAAHAERGIRLRLADESNITGKSIQLDGDKIALTLESGDARQVALTSVNGFEQINGPVSWLSSRQSSENIQTPYFEATFPARMNQSVTRKPIRFGDKSFACGIGVHSYSRMSWDLDGIYNTFRTQYAIDGDGAYANVTVRIKLDDNVVHEKVDVVAGELSPVIAIPLGSAKRLMLEVDYGKTYDTQDRFNWIEPALLKFAPTTQP